MAGLENAYFASLCQEGLLPAMGDTFPGEGSLSLNQPYC